MNNSEKSATPTNDRTNSEELTDDQIREILRTAKIREYTSDGWDWLARQCKDEDLRRQCSYNATAQYHREEATIDAI